MTQLLSSVSVIRLFRGTSGFIVLLGCVGVYKRNPVIVVIGCVLRILWQWVVKGRKGRLADVVLLRPVPIEAKWLLEAADDGDTLLWNRFSVGVLVAHHDNSFTINS